MSSRALYFRYGPRIQPVNAGRGPSGGSMDKKDRAKTILRLFLTFMKIGAFTFGGGYAMIPLIQKETVEKRKWISDKDMLDIVAIAESTPGPIAINSATFVGSKICGTAGALAATIGVVLPSFVIIYAISFILKEFEDAKAVVYAFRGVRAGVLALILKALISMYKQCPKGLFSYIIIGASFIAAALCGINVMLVIAVCAAAGIIYTFAAAGRKRT